MFGMILKDLRIHPVRSILTGLSMFVGILAMIASVLVGTLGREYLIAVNEQLYGRAPSYSFSSDGGNLKDLSALTRFLRDTDTLDDAVAAILLPEENLRFAELPSLLSFEKNKTELYRALQPFDLILTTSAYRRIYHLPMSSGQWFSSGESTLAPSLILNKKAADLIRTPFVAANFSRSLVLLPLPVRGIVNDGKDSPLIYMDAEALLPLLPSLSEIQSLNLVWHSEKGRSLQQMTSALNDLCADSIGGYIRFTNRIDIGSSYDTVLSALRTGLLLSALLLLFVSILGQINIGLASLEQRTHELLIRRALGASRNNLIALVLSSQLLLSALVSAFAVLVSLIAVRAAGIFLPPDSPAAAPSYPFLAALVAVTSSLAVSLLGGLLPALKAARLEPALALR